MKNVEVEIQVNVENISPLKNLLEKKAKFISEELEVDQYFNAPHRDFAKKKVISEWLRLRDANGKQSINYKYWHRGKDNKTDHCTEYETEVSDGSQVKKILEALDFKELVKVEKTRKKYRFEKYEITIDKVVGLDESVEIEYKGESANSPAEITAEMVKFLKDLGVGKMKRSYQGYAFLCLRPELAEYEIIE